MIVQKILYFVHLIKTMFWRKVSETIKNTLIKIGVGVLSLLFMLCIYRSYTLYGNGELGMNYMLGNGIAFFLLFLTIISLCAAVIFIIIGLIKKIRKVAAKSFYNIYNTISYISYINPYFPFHYIKSNEYRGRISGYSSSKEKEADYLKAAASFYNTIETFEYSASYVLSEYSTTWSNAINNRSDFNTALRSKKKLIIWL